MLAIVTRWTVARSASSCCVNNRDSRIRLSDGRVALSFQRHGNAVGIIAPGVQWASLRKYFQVGSSGSRLLLVAGEAGVGKTRLIEEVVEWRRGHGDLPAVPACYRGGVISYAPVAAWLREPRVETTRTGLRDLWLGEIGRIAPEVLAERPDLTPRPMTEDWQR